LLSFSGCTTLRRSTRKHDILAGGSKLSMQPDGSVYDFSAPLLDGQAISLAEFKGKVLLIVNTASKCGFTPQYAGLEELYRTHREQGFEVLGFPCNQFGAQEPGTEQDIGAFCERNYGVTFPMFAKIDVNGDAAHPLFRFLKQSKPGLFGSQRIKWNFTKFLIDRTGRVVNRFGPSTKPQELSGRVEELLKG
jgi:glutathione peroxidase